MRALLIDPEFQTVTEIDTDASLASLQKLVGGYIEYFTAGLPAGHHGIVDEEALLKGPRYFFRLVAGHQALAGRCVVLADAPRTDGHEAPCTLSVDFVLSRMTWAELLPGPHDMVEKRNHVVLSHCPPCRDPSRCHFWNWCVLRDEFPPLDGVSS